MVCAEDPVCTPAGEENLHPQQPQTENLPGPACLQQPCTAHTRQQHPVLLPQKFWAEVFPCLERGSRKQGHVKHIYELQNLQLTLPQAAQR